MSFLLVTIPVSLLVALCLLGLVLWAVAGGAFDDWDAPARRMLWDDDRSPEIERTYAEAPDLGSHDSPGAGPVDSEPDPAAGD